MSSHVPLRTACLSQSIHFLVIVCVVFVVFGPPEMNLGVSPASHEEADDMGRIKNVVKMLGEWIR